MSHSERRRYGLDPSHKQLSRLYLEDRQIAKFDRSRVDQETLNSDYLELDDNDGLGRTDFNTFQIKTPEKNIFDIRELSKIKG